MGLFATLYEQQEKWTQVGNIHVRDHHDDEYGHMHTTYLKHEGKHIELATHEDHEEAMAYAKHNKNRTPKISTTTGPGPEERYVNNFKHPKPKTK